MIALTFIIIGIFVCILVLTRRVEQLEDWQRNCKAARED